METKKCSVMVDRLGNEVPTAYVSKYDKARDKTVRGIVGRARKLRGQLEAFVRETLDGMAELAVVRGAEKMGVKGNFCVSSFDGLLAVEVSQQYNIFLDERVAGARDKMLGYVDRVLGRVNAKDAAALKVIIETAFRVGSNGMLSKAKVFALIAMNIDDADWRSAQDILRESIKPTRGKRYLRISARADHNHPWKQILLDLADCWPTDGEYNFSR